MKTKIVLWGETSAEEKVLIAMELIEAQNVVRINTIPAKDVTESFYNQMMNQWRNGQDLLLPESTNTSDRPLTMTDGLLPDELKTDRQDILARAKTEWHFVVLSSKLYNTYAEEITEFKERIDGLTAYDNAVWDEMKEFWSKVQAQVREQNIFREHAIELRSRTNQLFDNLKSLRKAMNDEYEKVSRDYMTQFNTKLDNIEERIKSGLGLHPIFNELKDLQKDFKNTKFTRKHHNDVWKRIDQAFKLAKEKKYGSKSGNSSGAVGRLESRYNGLLSAIDRMSKSINRDKKDEQFQVKRINTTDGQLELQIRQAKMAMIQERLASKQVKLDDMLKTKSQLEEKMELEKKKEAARQAKKEEKAKLQKAKDEAKQTIAEEMKSNSVALKEKEEKLKKAAEAIKKRKEGKTPMPVADAPVADAPVADAPVADAPVADAPVADAPVAENKISENEIQTASANTPSSDEDEIAHVVEIANPNYLELVEDNHSSEEAVAQPNTPEATADNSVVQEEVSATEEE